jgi:hypothetical protein
MRRITLLFLTACLVLLLLPVAAQAMTYDQAVDRLLARHYPQKVETYLNSLGTNPLGFRLAGTPSDNAAAQYLKDQFDDMGLTGAALEGVPVDAWDVQGAWVRANGRTMNASQFAGVPGTAPAGLTGDVVYVGMGLAPDYVGKDVTGKLVLVDIELDDFWLNQQGAEAGFHGAKGVICTWGENTTPWYMPMTSLGGNDGEYDMTWPPLVYISRADGAWLKGQVAAGPVTATLRSDVVVTMHDFVTPANGGLGYNVVARIPGSVPTAPITLVVAHHDAHFRPGMDDTGAVATQMLVARAMAMSGVKPRGDIVFLTTTGEEFGYTDCWYDWCIGAWYAATVTHQADWPGKIGAMINLELMARKGSKLSIGSTPALAPWLRKQAKSVTGSLLPWGYHLSTPVSTWEDCWTFTAAGVPSFVIEAGGKNYDDIYHTTFEKQSLVSWPYVAKIGKFVGKLARKVDTGLLPYDPRAQIANLKAAVTGDDPTGLGADATTVTTFREAMHGFEVAATSYLARKSTIPAADRAADNVKLMALEKAWNTQMNSLDIWDYNCYPYQQALWDVYYLDGVLDSLQADPVKKADALGWLANVSQMWNQWSGEQPTLSHQVFLDDRARRLPGYALITWAGQVQSAPNLDLKTDLDRINADDFAGAITGLTAVRASSLTYVNARLVEMTTALNAMTTQLDDID